MAELIFYNWNSAGSVIRALCRPLDATQVIIDNWDDSVAGASDPLEGDMVEFISYDTGESLFDSIYVKASDTPENPTLADVNIDILFNDTAVILTVVPGQVISVIGINLGT